MTYKDNDLLCTKNKKQYEPDKFEDCSIEDTKAKTKPALKNLQKDERNPKNEETLVNDNIQQSRKSFQNRQRQSFQNRQELRNDTHNSMTEETTENNRKKKWRVHHNNIKDKLDTSESEDEADTGNKSDDIEVDTGNNENYKKIRPLTCYKSFLVCDKWILFPLVPETYFKLISQSTDIQNQLVKNEENMTYKLILSHYNSLLASLKRNKFEENVESVNFRMIFIDNLPVEVDEGNVRELFEPCGHIEHIQIYTLKKYYGKRVNKAKKRKLTKVASITFSTISAAQKAVSKNPLWLNNYYVNIQFFNDAHIKIETFMINRIFLHNVPHNVTKETLCKFFDDCGEPLYIRYLHKACTEEFTGIVYVQFQSPEAVRLALQKNDQYLNGTCLTITQNLELPKNTKLSQLFYTSFQGLRAAIEKNLK